jgi:transcriptional regulator with XRE-family HTH domain
MTIEHPEFTPWDAIPALTELKQQQTFGSNLRTWRECQGWSLTQTAALLNINKALLSEYERGIKLPSIKKTLEMAVKLDASPEMWLQYRLEDDLRQLGYQATGHLKLEPIAS